jgi:hypothetical protein
MFEFIVLAVLLQILLAYLWEVDPAWTFVAVMLTLLAGAVVFAL